MAMISDLPAVFLDGRSLPSDSKLKRALGDYVATNGVLIVDLPDRALLPVAEAAMSELAGGGTARDIPPDAPFAAPKAKLSLRGVYGVDGRLAALCVTPETAQAAYLLVKQRVVSKFLAGGYATSYEGADKNVARVAALHRLFKASEARPKELATPVVGPGTNAPAVPPVVGARPASILPPSKTVQPEAKPAEPEKTEAPRAEDLKLPDAPQIEEKKPEADEVW